MKATAERRLGLTPIVKRIAFYYLSLGYGTYHPENHPHFDTVIVRELYEFMENPSVPGEHAGGTIVEFFSSGQRVKYVEFRCQVVGGGGESVAQPLR
jgi:hypothetical protein